MAPPNLFPLVVIAGKSLSPPHKLQFPAACSAVVAYARRRRMELSTQLSVRLLHMCVDIVVSGCRIGLLDDLCRADLAGSW